MFFKQSIAKITLLLAAWAWLLGSILLAKALYEQPSIFPLGQLNEALLGYMLVFFLGLAGAAFYMLNRILIKKRSAIG